MTMIFSQKRAGYPPPLCVLTVSSHVFHSEVLGNPRLLWVDATDVGALRVEWTFAALWPLGVADLAAVADQADVQAINPVRWRDFGEDSVGLVGVDLWSDQA